MITIVLMQGDNRPGVLCQREANGRPRYWHQQSGGPTQGAGHKQLDNLQFTHKCGDRQDMSTEQGYQTGLQDTRSKRREQEQQAPRRQRVQQAPLRKPHSIEGGATGTAATILSTAGTIGTAADPSTPNQMQRIYRARACTAMCVYRQEPATDG